MTSRRLIVTADDFGLSTAVNDAVERAHREGILTTASLMVGADASQDAVGRARSLPGLHVGLHVVVVNGRPVLPPERVPDLVDAHGQFPSRLGHAGVTFFWNARAREQLEAEIRAQFEAFARTGLALDHVNAQNHMHVHPTVLGLILKVGRDYGMQAVRLPYERSSRWSTALGLAPWLRLMRARLDRAGLAHNDYVLGMRDTGRMTRTRVLALLDTLAPGVTELYFHPEIGNEEFAALIDPDVVRKVRDAGITCVHFNELADAS